MDFGAPASRRSRATVKRSGSCTAPDWKIWFAADGDPRHGTADDPRMALVGVDIHAAVFLEVGKSKPVVLYEMVKGWLTGTAPDAR